MKKKLLIILLVLVLAATLIVATACNDSGMIVKNNERDFTQSTADITYAGRASQVDKLELNATIYNFVYQYYSYYQQGYLSQSQYQSVLDNLPKSYEQANESLAETEAYTLKCIDELYKLAIADDSMKAGALAASTVGKAYNVSDRIKEIESILPKKDLIAAIDAYNEEMQTSFDSFREAYESEIAASAASQSTENVKEVKVLSAPGKLTYEKGESLNEAGLKVGVIYEGSTEAVALERSEYTVTGFSSDEVKDDLEVTVTFANKTATFKVNIVAAKPARPKMPTDEEEEEKTEISDLFEVDLQKQIDKARADKDNDLYKALTESKRRLEKQMDSNYRNYEYYYLSKLKTQVVTAYEDIIGKAASVNTTDIQAEYAKRKGEQKSALRVGSSTYSDLVSGTGVKTQIVHEDGQYFYVMNLLFKITDDLQEVYDAFEAEKVANDKALEEYLHQQIDKIGVYVSNIEYDKDAKCEVENCTCKACENYTGENPGECTCEKCTNKRFITEKFAEEHGLTVTNGTVNVHDVIDAIYADLGTVEDTAAGRAQIIEKFKKWIYMVNDDEGFFTTLSDGKLGYGLSQTESSYVENFTGIARMLAYGTAQEKEDSDWHIVGNGVGSYGWCYTEYGIHIVMLSGYALDPEYAVDDNKLEGTDYYALPQNAVVDYTTYEAATETDLAKGSLEYEIKETLLQDKKDEIVGAFKKAFYQKEMKDGVTITYHEVYQDLIDQYTESK